MTESSGQLEVARAVFGDRFGLAQRYVDILASDGVERGLLGPREVPRLWPRHLLNSYALAGLVPAGASVVDVGSGAGLPVIPLAIGRPDLRVTLLEPLLRRANFLESAVDDLALGDRASVSRARAEEVTGRWDAVVSRAVAPLGRLAEWSVPLTADGGSVLALKGRSASDEVRAARRTLERLGVRAEVLEVRAHADAEPTTAVRLRRD